MKEWKICKVKDLAIMKNGKKRPNTIGHYPVYGGNGIMDYCNTYNNENTIIIGRVGAYCGNVFYCKGKCWVSDNAIALCANSNNDITYLYYLLTSLDLHQNHIGGAQPLMTQDIIGNFDVCVPELETQIQIANILSSVDKKIELNRQINDNLEQQAKALYKSWFIDFEPFADSEFVDSEIGEIPKELRVDHIGSISHRIESGRRPKGGACDSGVPSVGAENIKKLGYYDFSKTKYIPTDFANNITRGKVNGYELLIYKDGGKPGYFLPSFSIFGDGFPYDVFYINEHVFILDLKNDQYNAFAYFYMQTDYIMTQLNALGGKAAIPGINTSDVESLPIISYSHPKVQEFGKYAHDIVKTILRNSRENARLAQLRDTLLPNS